MWSQYIARVHCNLFAYWISFPAFTGAITILTSASTTTLMFTVLTTPVQSQTSGRNATFSTWSTMMATARVTTLPKASNAGSATGLCHRTGRSSSQRSSSSSPPFPWALSFVLAENTIISVSIMQMFASCHICFSSNFRAQHHLMYHFH